MREGKANNLLAALAQDSRIPFNLLELDALIGAPLDFVGDARAQVAQVVSQIEVLIKKFPIAAAYRPSSIR